jgi:hypothetical protein
LSHASDDVNQLALSQFKQAHPQARFYGTQFYDNDGFYDDIGTFNAIYGTVLATGLSPIDSAWNHVNELNGIFAVEIGELIPATDSDGNVLHGAMYDPATETYRFQTFRFNQVVAGIPVFRSGIGFLVRNEQNFPLVMSSSNFKEMQRFEVGDVGQAVVTEAMRTNVLAMMDAQPVLHSVLARKAPLPLEVSGEQLVIWAGVGNVQVNPELAVVFIAQRGSVTTLPDYQKHLVVASVATGEILYSENQIHNVDIAGNVSGRATQGLNALECDPEVAVPMPYARVQVVGGSSTFADANGDFVVPNAGSTAVTVRSFLNGQFFDLFDQSAGGSTPQIDTSVTPPGPVNILHNPTANQQFPTANVNAYVESNVVRDYVLSYVPNFPVINNQTGFDINTNINSSCNAFYDGVSINFYRNGGGCNNTAFTDVVYHEYGHHLIQVTGNGQGQMGEGSGDVMGVLIQDDPILGQGFETCGQGIRNANNNLQYPQNGPIHDSGQLISACVWSLRNQLIQTEPSSYRDIGASLFLGMLVVRGQMEPGNPTIDPMITIYYLELDDDDGNIGNGTPHYQEIANAFGSHNMDAPPLVLLEFAFPDGRPEYISPNGGVAFNVEVTALTQNPEPGTGVLHVDRGNGFETFPMAEVSTNVYEANFPASDCGTQLRYYFSAQTTTGQTQLGPTTAPDSFYTAISGDSATIVFADNFQTNLGWTVSGNATDGQWTRGVPIGGGDRGDPANDGDGSGACYLTDNTDGNSDVDGGSTILTSPIMDASTTGDDVAIISYYRWYSNNFGAAPESDIFVVEISNNGGATWTNLETVGPTGPEVRGGWFQKSFRINDILTPTAQMRLRFTASDLGDGSVVEAAVDGVQVVMVSCDPANPVVIPPDSFLVTRGTYVSGGISELSNSDDADLSIVRSASDLQSRTEFEISAVSPNANPVLFEVSLEGSVFARSAVSQTIELFNYATGVWETVDTRDAGRFTDATATVAASGDLSRYVEAGTMAIRARVRFQSPVARQQFSSNVDLFSWTIQ